MRIPARVALLSFAMGFGVPFAQAALPAHPAVHTLEPSTQEIGDDWFVDIRAGSSVAIRNETALVGMPGLNKVAIYKRSSAGWAHSGSIAAPEATTEFGLAIAYRDDTTVVASDSGAYVFKLVNGAWKYTQKLVADSSSVSFDVLAYQDNIVVAGSPQIDAPGAVYVFELTSAGKLARRVKLQATDAQAGDGFGTDVSMSTNLIVIGAPGSGDGAAYVFRRSANRWSQKQRLSGQGSSGEGFGQSVAVNNGVIVVGAPYEDYEWSETETGFNAAGGAAFLFVANTSGVFVQTQRIRPSSSDVANFQDFGSDVVMSGNRIAVIASELIAGPGDYAAGEAFTYTLANNRASPLGFVKLAPPFRSAAFANSWLLVGQPYDGGCGFNGCIGQATLYDVSKTR